MLLGKGAMQRSASARSTKMSKRVSEPPPVRARSKSPRGPERFFYDRSTYTGTHRHGGPSFVGNGLPKEEGYGDLSDLVNRTHVQDLCFFACTVRLVCFLPLYELWIIIIRTRPLTGLIKSGSSWRTS